MDLDYRREEDVSEIAWPGFVDILSTLIMIFVFFVMITSVVMYAMSVNHKRMIEAQQESRIRTEVEAIKSEILSKNQISAQEFEDEVQKITENRKFSEENVLLSQKIAEMEAEIAKLKADLSESLTQHVIKDALKGELLIVFKRDTDVAITETTLKDIEQFFNDIAPSRLGAHDFIIEAGDDLQSEALSKMREVALARMMNMRSELIRQNVPKEKIELKNVPLKNEDTYQWIRIKVKKP